MLLYFIIIYIFIRFSVVLKRTSLLNRRDPIVFRGRIVGTILLGLIGGTIYY
jgi:hypothetical protein